MPKQLTCLLIDDDRDEYEIFCVALRQVSQPLECIYSSNATDALQKLGDPSFNPDIIFLDINMPKINGVQCLAEIRKMDRMRTTPVYMYSTSSYEKLIDQCKQLGATDYIAKSVTVSDIASTLQQIVAKMDN